MRREQTGQLQERLPEALAEQPAVGLGEERLLDLAGAHGLAVPGVEPDVHAVADVGDRMLHHPGSEEEQNQPGDDVGEAGGRHVEKGQEGAEEHQRAAEITDEHEHQHRCAPDREQGAEVLQRRDREAGNASRPHGEQLALLV